ncbi:MAG: ROK family protein [Treponema sp.]|jgi:predicted NBD/HSP70 family sugar kinase|nr:ROK family protein [Treponema sp.]
MKIAVLDIGGTAIKSGVFENGELSERKELPANARLGGLHLMETAKKIIAEHSGLDCIGISTAGQVDSEQGIIKYANQNIPDYTGIKIQEIFQETFNVPVVVENDVNAAAIGEAVFGNGQIAKDKNFLCLTYGTGIGGAVVIDGKIFKGASFSAGEIGHIITHGSKTCPGYYEKYASTAALVKNVQAVLPELDDGRKIIMNLEQAAVREIVDKWIDEILYGLASLIHIFNPSLIILGGGIMKEAYVIESLRKKIHSYIMPSFGDVILASAALGNDAGLWGIGYLAGLKTGRKND